MMHALTRMLFANQTSRLDHAMSRPQIGTQSSGAAMTRLVQGEICLVSGGASGGSDSPKGGWALSVATSVAV